jgi:tetratricopeptide (TPR) repeat protein
VVDTLIERATVPGADVAPPDPDVRPPAAPPRRRVLSVLLVAGFVAGIGSLAFPWMDLSLQPSLRAFDLSPGLGRLQFPSFLSYGAIVSIVMVVAVTSVVRAGWRPTVTSGRCGWMLLALGVIFVASTLISDGHVQWLLQSDSDQLQIFYNQIPSTSILSPPTNYLGVNLDQSTTNFLNDIGAGLFYLLATGLLLVVGAPRRGGRIRRLPGLVLGVAVVVVLVGLGTGWMARNQEVAGINNEALGNPVAAVANLHAALRWDPSLRYDPQLVSALGQAEADQGQRTPLAAFARADRPAAQYPLLISSLLLDEQAQAAAPNNPVIAQSLADLLARLSALQRKPVTAPAALSESRYPALTYTLAHYYYDTGDYQTAIRMMRRALTESRNTEFDSYALTYIALSEQATGQEVAYRRDIVAAIKDDTQVANGLARDIASGQYLPSRP